MERSPRALVRLLRIFFYLLYRPMAFAYDGVAWVVSLGMWNKWVLSILPEVEGERVLELGPGPGHLLRAMSEAGITCVGLESSPQMVGLARERSRVLVGVGFEMPGLVCGYAQNMPFSDTCFDQVVATFPSEYLWDLKALHEIHRVLTPGGSLLVLPVAWITGQRSVHRLAAWLFRTTGQAPDPENDRFSQELLARLQQAGFEAQLAIKQLEDSTLLLAHARPR